MNKNALHILLDRIAISDREDLEFDWYGGYYHTFADI